MPTKSGHRGHREDTEHTEKKGPSGSHLKIAFDIVSLRPLWSL